MKNYNTRQKQAIHKAIALFDNGHFTCEDVLNKIKEQGENAGMTTVYRYLDKLVKEDVLIKYVPSQGESACYQHKEGCDGHFHLRCVSCGKLIHLSCKSLELIGQHVKDEHDFSIDPAKTVFYGLCGECK